MRDGYEQKSTRMPSSTLCLPAFEYEPEQLKDEFCKDFQLRYFPALTSPSTELVQNPARTFSQDNYVAALEYEGLPCKEVYESYVTWCHENGYRPLNSNNFGKEVRRTLPGAERQHKRQGARQVWLYSGLAVKEGSEVAVGFAGYCH